MSEYDELVDVLTFLLTKRLQAKLEFTRGLLGDGQQNTDVPDRDGFSFIRPDRSTSKVFEMFNKMAFGVDGTPILIGELPWQPGLIQVVGIDWETYMQVGWDSRFAGLAKHGNEHIWRDGQPGADTFNIFRRQIWPLRTEAVGSGSTSVTVNPYDYINHAGSRRAWPGTPGIDLAAALPASSGSQRYALVYWDYTVSGSVYGQLSVATGTLAVNAPTITPSKPIEPTGAIPSAFVRLVGTQQTVTDLDIVDARPLWGDGSILNVDRAHVSRLYQPDDSAIVVQATNAGNVGIGTINPLAKLDVLATVTQLRLTHTDASKFADFTVDTNHDLTIQPSSTGQVVFQPTTDSLDFFQVLDAGGGDPVLSVDSINERVGISTNSPVATLSISPTSSTDELLEISGATTKSLINVISTITPAANPQILRFVPTITPAGAITTVFGANLSPVIAGSGSDTITNLIMYAAGGTFGGSYSGTVTNLFDYRAVEIIDNSSGAPAVTNHYAFWTQNFTFAANSFGIYQQGTGVRNQMQGTVGIGLLTAPLAQLHIDQNDDSAAIPVALFDQADVSEGMFEFVSTIGVGNAIEAVGAKTLTVTHFIKVKLPGGLTRYQEVGTIA